MAKSSKLGRYANGSAIDDSELLLWIETFIARNPLPPSVREIAVGFRPKMPRLSTNTVYYHLEALEAAGKIKRNGKPCGITVLDPAEIGGIHGPHVSR